MTTGQLSGVAATPMAVRACVPNIFAKEFDNQAGSAIDYMCRTVETGCRENKSIDPQPRDDAVKIANRPPHTAEN